MRNTAGSDPGPNSRNDNYFSVVSDLVSLIEHVQASMTMLEQAIALRVFGEQLPGVVSVHRSVGRSAVGVMVSFSLARVFRTVGDLPWANGGTRARRCR